MTRFALAVLGAGLLLAQSPAELKFPPLRPVRIPQVESYRLANGLRIYLLENHELPLVSGVALVRTGSLFDPAEKTGLAAMAGMVLRSGGAGNRSGDRLNEELENVAASVESWVGSSVGQVSFSALKENAAFVLDAFHDVLTGPAFQHDKIELARTQLRSEIARRNDDPFAIAAREFYALLYGRDTPYGRQMEYETVDRIGRDDLLAFYRRYYFPANILLGIYGDFSTREMKLRLARLFGTWTASQPPVPPFPELKARPAPGVFLATKDVNQTAFYLGHLGGVLRDKDEPALEIMADILGGGFSSRLFQRVRTQLGYAYNVDASWAANYLFPGALEITGSTKSSLTTDAIHVVREEVIRLRTAEVSGQELETARQAALNSFVFHFDTPAKTLSRVLRYEYYGYPRDFIFRYQKAIAAVTAADVLRVARRYVHPEDFTIVVVGNPRQFGQPLAALGLPVHSIDLRGTELAETRR